jgi:predicted nucleotide-binding protein
VAEGLNDELFAVADAAGKLLTRIRDEKFQKPLVALRKACEAVKRTWSGSNLGYHADVYYEGFQSKPPGVEFSPEWGLLDEWPTHQPDRGWCVMDPQAVLDEIYRRAGQPDIERLTHGLAALRSSFFSLQEEAKSILATVLEATRDSVLADKLERIKGLIAPDPSAIEPTLVRRGQGWSRDSHAVSQGFRIAPHQSALALPLSATTLENSIDALEKASREAASHVRRRKGHGRASKVNGAAIFIGHGHSPLWRELKDFIKDRLHLNVVEFNSVSAAGIATSARLSELLDAAGFAFLVMTGEDEQQAGTMRARENVVHEAGLFQGRLGFKRAIILLEEGCEEFSNIHGLGQIRFPKGHVSAKFEEIRAVLEREGMLRG